MVRKPTAITLPFTNIDTRKFVCICAVRMCVCVCVCLLRDKTGGKQLKFKSVPFEFGYDNTNRFSQSVKTLGLGQTELSVSCVKRVWFSWSCVCIELGQHYYRTLAEKVYTLSVYLIPQSSVWPMDRPLCQLVAAQSSCCRLSVCCVDPLSWYVAQGHIFCGFFLPIRMSVLVNHSYSVDILYPVKAFCLKSLCGQTRTTLRTTEVNKTDRKFTEHQEGSWVECLLTLYVFMGYRKCQASSSCLIRSVLVCLYLAVWFSTRRGQTKVCLCFSNHLVNLIKVYLLLLWIWHL